MTNVNAAEGSVTLLNRGRRHFDLPFVDGKPVGRHAPGSTHTYSAEDAARLLGYVDLVDISKIPGAIDTRALQSENATLKAEREALKAQLEALQPKKKIKEEAKKEEEVKA